MPGHRLDWVALFRLNSKAHAGAAKEELVSYAYLQARTLGSLELSTMQNGIPLQPGEYELRLLLDDSPTVLASVPVLLH
jgi:hypothetical protein